MRFTVIAILRKGCKIARVKGAKDVLFWSSSLLSDSGEVEIFRMVILCIINIQEGVM
jgi:hypothetical protein